jgi:YfiH family protein
MRSIMYNIIRADKREVLKQNEYILHGDDDNRETSIEYLTFAGLDATGIVKHLFTTRLGGVSEGFLSSMNLNFNRGDKPENVLENYTRIGKILDITPDDMVLSMQTHTTNIRRVYREDAGKGVTKPLDYQDVDGLVTDEPGLALVTSFADCVPLYFADKRHKAIGLAHSGWKGTAAGMGKCMVETMHDEFGSRPEDIAAAIGPSICRDCYEVSADVAEVFQKLFEGDDALIRQISAGGYKSGYAGKDTAVVVQGKKCGKYQLDLWLANILILMKAGIPIENIEVTDICTCHNPEYLFSHRASQGKRGNLSAFLMLKQ